MEGYYKSPLFEGLDQQTIDCLLDHKCRLRDYAPGELVALQGDVYKSLLIVDKGLLRAEMTDSEGTRVTLEEIVSPRTVAPAFVYATNNCLPVSIFAVLPSSVLSISKNKLTTIMHNDSRVLENFLSIISDRSRFLSERLRLLSFGTIKSKLRSYFLELTRDNDYGTFTVPHTHQELADMFGVTRPALSRAIRQLEDSGTIRRKGGRRYELLQ